LKIIRVFPQKTSYTPDDDMVFIGEPPGLIIPEHDEIHISCTFTWDMPYCEYLKDQWEMWADKPVRLGGVAYGSGNHVQILTKGGEIAERDFDLLDSNDWFGTTYTVPNGEWQKQLEPNAATTFDRLESLERARNRCIKTWVSLEPVYDPDMVYFLIRTAWHIDLFRIGKLNYQPSDINWFEFGHKCVELCKKHGRNYYIKNDLRKEMNA